MKKMTDEFMEYIKEMRFMNIDELFIKKNMVRDKFGDLNDNYREMYKWYFFYELCLLKNPLKSLMWDYVCGRDVLNELNIEYINFCNKRDKIAMREI